jgi:hypothetical protein
MTVQSQTSRADYTGNGATTLFTVPFYFLLSTDIQVILTDEGTSPVTVATLALGTDYAVAGVANPAGGSITTVVAPTATQRISILRSVPYTQLKHYVPNDPFPAASHEMGLDKLTMEVQQLAEVQSRALTLAPNTDPSTVSPVLPTPESNKLLGWNQTATALQNVDPATMATIVAFGTANSDVFSGTGAQTVFGLSANPGAMNNLDVAISGVTQRPGIDYTWTSGTALTFTVAPPVGTNNVLARYMQGLPQGVSDSAASVWTQNGTGAITRTTSDKLHDLSVDLSDFVGADPTGSTPSDLALQAALNTGKTVNLGPFGNVWRFNALSTRTGKTVVFGQGARVNTDVMFLKVIDGSGSRIFGFSIYPVTTPWTIKRNTTTWVNVSGDVVQSLEGYIPSVQDADIYPGMSTAQKNLNAGINPAMYFTASSAAGVTDVEINGIHGRQITIIMEGCVYSTVRNCDFGAGQLSYGGIVWVNGVNRRYNSSIPGFAFPRGVGNSADNNKIKYATLCAIVWFGNDNFSMCNNTSAFNGESGYKLYGYDGVAGPSETSACISTGGLIDGNRASDNYFDGFDLQVTYPPIPPTYVYSGTVVSGNTSMRNRHTGSITNASNMVYVGNHFNSNGTHGLSVVGTANTVIANHARSNCTTGTTLVPQVFDIILEGDDCVGAFNNISNASAPSTYNYFHTGALGAAPTSSHEGLDFGNYCDGGLSRLAVSASIPSTKMGITGVPFVQTTGYLQTGKASSLPSNTYTLVDTDVALNCFPTATATLTLPNPATYPGRDIMLRNTNNFAINSASANVAPLAGGAPTTAILPATPGKWAHLKSDGSAWLIMAAN